MNKKIFHIINGPNLNLLGRRETSIYGAVSFEEYLKELRPSYAEIDINYFQSNHEGDLIDYLHSIGFTSNGILLNAGGYTHTSIALADAVRAISTPVIEIHISNIHQREEFRRISYLTEPSIAQYIGMGLPGYEMGLKRLIALSDTLNEH